MTATVGDIYAEIDSFAPFDTAMDFDNVGLLVGSPDTRVANVLLSLDITPDVVLEAAEQGTELIVSHHPVIFDPLRRIVPDSAPYLLARHGIAAICAHTNLDLAPGGVNTCLARRLGLENIRAIREYGAARLPEGLLGELDRAYPPEKFASFVKRSLCCGGLKYTHGNRPVHTVGLCSGAGADLLFDAAALGADAFVTADTKHHQLLAAVQVGITLVDAGHFSTEDVVIPPLLERLRLRFPGVAFRKSEKMQDPVRYL